MRLISMHVDNFGGLHNYDYNFEDGLNVILHDNGWGKTTMAAFLKAMLYGFDSKRSKDITENERKRYLPWQGGNYGGSLDFEAESVNYRIYRTFGDTPRFDKVKILNLDTHTSARIDPDKIGETLFKLDASAFQRSVFINQNGLSIDGAASSIHTRLNSLVSKANDVSAYDGAISTLTQQTKIYEKIGNKGQIADITRKIAELENQRDHLESDIQEQDVARERIQELDTLIGAINNDLEEKKKKLDEVFGQAKKNEASQKLLEDIENQISGLVNQIDSIKEALGGEVPSAEEIDHIKHQNQLITKLNEQLESLDAEFKKLSSDYQEILDRYGNDLPTTAQLDEIQSIYGELQGAKGTGTEETLDTESEPEGYSIINGILRENPDYPDKLQTTIDVQTNIQQLNKKLEEQNRAIQKENETWEDNKKRYDALKKDVEEVQPDVDASAKYNHEEVAPIISILEELQKKQQLVDVKVDELSGIRISPEEEALLDNAPEKFPDITEAKTILLKLRDMSKKQADLQGLSSKLEGEKYKSDSLQKLIFQLGSTPEEDTTTIQEPKKSTSSAIIGTGAAITVLGIALILVNPVLAIIAVVGAVLTVFGVLENNKYKVQYKEYETYKEKASHSEENKIRKADLEQQLKNVQANISDYEQQILNLDKEISAYQTIVDKWFSEWAPGASEISESSMTEILERYERIIEIKAKKQEASDKQKSIDESMEQIRSGRVEADTKYPEISGKTIAEALSFLRAEETDYRIKTERLDSAKNKLDEYVSDMGLNCEQLAEEKSPKYVELKTNCDETAKELSNLLDDANEVLGAINLHATAEDVLSVFRKAEQCLNEYKLYTDKIKDKDERQQKIQNHVEELQKKIEEKQNFLRDNYADLVLPERLTKIREDITNSNNLKSRITDIEKSRSDQRKQLDEARSSVDAFINTYGHFIAETDDILSEIYTKASSFSELDAARNELEKQKIGMAPIQSEDVNPSGEEETELRRQVSELEKRRDALRDEYTQKSDFIRQADKSLEKYPDVIQEIRQLYDQKQKSQNTLVMLRRTIQLIMKAKENLANRYLSKVEDTFNNYMHVWLNNDAVRGILDIDFKVTIEENDKAHVAEGYSTGYCDLIDFCMRLALVDTLFEKEQPFLILDDPFVNLDADRLDKALELLSVLAANKQLIYFVCHPIRAVEIDENSKSRAEFIQLAEATRKSLEDRKTTNVERKKLVRKSPKEMYKVINPEAILPFKPAKPDYVITNNIFSLNFVMNDIGIPKDNTYELFFIDSIGHVLNERQIIEITNGKLSTERVQFCLNTRDDSGDEYELMIRESGQDDYDVIARIPFKANLAFAGTFSFDF